MSQNYPWYEVVSGDRLEQGDILQQCHLPVPLNNINLAINPPQNNINIKIQVLDLIIITQSCDLINNGKVNDVTLCMHLDLMQTPEVPRKDWDSIKQGRRPRYHLLNDFTDDPDMLMGFRIIDFSRVFTLPKQAIEQFATSKAKRLRLLSPYREHMSQSFARFFMRIGLPQDIQLPK